MSLQWSSKKDSRSYFRSLFIQESSQNLDARQLQLNTVLHGYMSTQKGIWGAYRSLSTEASVDAAYENSPDKWVFPKVNRDQLDFYQPSGFSIGSYGILEPSLDSKKVDLSQVAGLLIPGLGFNKNGSRLGKGKGFYDRALVDFQGIKVGVCFKFQIADMQLPTAEFDIPMDYLICEAGVVDCKMYRES